MSDLFVHTGEVAGAVESLQDHADAAMLQSGLPSCDVGNATGTEALMLLAASVGEFPAGLVEQASLIVLAVTLGVQDAIAADQVDTLGPGPR